MDRLSMLREATRLAHETVDSNSALNDPDYAALSKLSKDDAISKLAKTILEDAAFNIEI